MNMGFGPYGRVTEKADSKTPWHWGLTELLSSARDRAPNGLVGASTTVCCPEEARNNKSVQLPKKGEREQMTALMKAATDATTEKHII